MIARHPDPEAEKHQRLTADNKCFYKMKVKTEKERNRHLIWILYATTMHC